VVLADVALPELLDRRSPDARGRLQDPLVHGGLEPLPHCLQEFWLRCEDAPYEAHDACLQGLLDAVVDPGDVAGGGALGYLLEVEVLAVSGAWVVAQMAAPSGVGGA